MTDESPQSPPRLPDEPGRSVEITGKSGKTFIVTKRSEPHTFEIELPDIPGYLAILWEHGSDNFELKPLPGVVAVGGVGLSLQDLINNF